MITELRQSLIRIITRLTLAASITVIISPDLLSGQDTLSVFPSEFIFEFYLDDSINLTIDTVLTIVGGGNDSTLQWDYTLNPPLTFIKENYADWTQADNQDHIAPGIAITRKDIQSFFNPILESGYNDPYHYPAQSPVGTYWAFKNNPIDTSQVDNWEPFIEAVNHDPQGAIGKYGLLYLPAFEAYLDFSLLSFSGSNTGGGFAYTRDRIPASWLTVTRDSSRLDQPIEYLQLHLDATGLDAGQYESAILITPVDTILPEIQVPIKLNLIESVRIDQTVVVKESFQLFPNYPNPFNPVTTISYYLPENEYISIRIFDMLGKPVVSLVEKQQSAGFHEVQWDSRNFFGQPVGSGVYLVQIRGVNSIRSGKMILLK